MDYLKYLRSVIQSKEIMVDHYEKMGKHMGR
jgi:hypothetical protein